MKSNVFLSIIIPCYNGADFILDALTSLDQSVSENIEVIVVNDGSKDDTEHLVKNYINTHVNQNIRYFSTRNMGTGHARNFGINVSRGKWISFLDADDMNIDGSLQIIVNTLKEVSEDVDIIYSSKVCTDFTLNKEIQILQCSSTINDIIPSLEFWTGIYRSELLKKSVKFYEYKEQDIESAFRFIAKKKANKVFIDSNLLFYIQRRNINSNQNTWNIQNVIYIKTIVYLDLYKNYASSKEEKLYLKEAINDLVQQYFKNCLENGILDCKRWKQMKQIRKTLTNRKFELNIIEKYAYIKNSIKTLLHQKNKTMSKDLQKKNCAYDKLTIINNWKSLSNYLLKVILDV